MYVENWQVRFIEHPERLGREMVIYRKVGEQVEVMIFPQTLEIKTFRVGDNIPTGLYLTDDLFQSLVDSIHKDFKPSEGKFTEGKLMGTERHLEDLRKLLKLK